MTSPVTWWERQDPDTFLSSNQHHPSRSVSCEAAIALARRYGGTLIEVGPGPGIDYYRAFQAVDGTDIHYIGVEPTRRFYEALVARYPRASWIHGAIANLTLGSADVVYSRAVLEHQPALQPALGQLLAAARHAVVIDWYRPPSAVASCGFADTVPCHTFAVTDVLAGVYDAGFRVAEIRDVERNQIWTLERRA